MLKVAALLLAAVSAATEYDACVLGGGAGGASASVFLKDRGYNTLLIEKTDILGGHCNTIQIPNAPAGSASAYDIGVIVVVDTRSVNVALDGTPNGRFSLDTYSYLTRFVDSANLTYPNFGSSSSNFIVDTDHYYASGAVPESPVDPAYQTAFETLYYLVNVKYPWLPTLNYTGPIPDELLLPFEQFVTLYNLSPLYPSLFNGYLCSGGMCPYDKLTTLYALHNLDSSLLATLTGQARGYSFKNGCVSLYNGIAKYLGQNSVVYNSSVSSVTRNRDGTSTLKGQQTFTKKSFNYKCKNLVIAFPPTARNLKAIGLQLDPKEWNLLRSVDTKFYVAGLAEVAGTIKSSSNNSFTLSNLNITNSPSLQPTTFGWNGIQQTIPYAPKSTFYATLPSSIPESQVVSVVQGQFDQAVAVEQAVIPGQVTSIKVKDAYIHDFQPHPADSCINQVVNGQKTNFWSALRNLQGNKNTYWVGAVTNFAAHHYILSETHDIIRKHFQNKTRSA